MDGDLKLVRPEAFHEHPKHRPLRGNEEYGDDPSDDHRSGVDPDPAHGGN